MAYPANIVSEVQALIDSEIGPITRIGKILDILLKHNIAYVVDDIHPTYLMVHPENRSKLGVNPYNVHKVGSYIRKVGGDMKELANAVAFELSPKPAEKAKQVSFNKELMEHSAGMLAPLSGSERYLTVSCGHTSQFCRAVLAQCKTNQPNLQDKDGLLRVEHIAQDDPVLRTMVTKGWKWTILPFQAEEQWPGLPDLAQRALNASNSVANQASELEVASTIAEFANLQGKKGDVDWCRCQQAAVAGAPPCMAYVGVISDFVKKYGGGEGAPAIKFIDFFAKTFGGTKILGEEYFRAVTESSLHPSVMKPCPQLRVALVATNLVSPKVVDGIARLVTKTDIAAFCRKDRNQQMEECEGILVIAWDLCFKHVADGHFDISVAYLIIGRLYTRVVLHLASKGKQGPEHKVFDKMTDIQTAFADELTNALPTSVASGITWATSIPAVIAVPVSTQPLLSSADLTNPQRVANEAGFKVGSHYVEKKLKTIYRLESVAHVCTFVEHNLFSTEPTRLQLDVEATLTRMAPFKSSLPVRIQTTDILHINGIEKFEHDWLRAIVFATLAKRSPHCEHDFVYCLNPTEVRANATVPKGKLELVPHTLMANIVCKKPQATNALEVKVKGTAVWLTEPPRPRQSEVATWKSDMSFVPYWWVSTTDDEKVANIVPKRVICKDDDVSFFVYTNSKQLKPHDVLCVLEKHMTPPEQAQIPMPGTTGDKAQKSKGNAVMGKASVKKPRTK
jgi:hypothetical protein